MSYNSLTGQGVSGHGGHVQTTERRVAPHAAAIERPARRESRQTREDHARDLHQRQSQQGKKEEGGASGNAAILNVLNILLCIHSFISV